MRRGVGLAGGRGARREITQAWRPPCLLAPPVDRALDPRRPGRRRAGAGPAPHPCQSEAATGWEPGTRRPAANLAAARLGRGRTCASKVTAPVTSRQAPANKFIRIPRSYSSEAPGASERAAAAAAASASVRHRRAGRRVHARAATNGRTRQAGASNIRVTPGPHTAFYTVGQVVRPRSASRQRQQASRFFAWHGALRLRIPPVGTGRGPQPRPSLRLRAASRTPSR